VVPHVDAVLSWLTSPDVLDGYVTGAPSTWCELKGRG
jgi:hypothetical protein